MPGARGEVGGFPPDETAGSVELGPILKFGTERSASFGAAKQLVAPMWRFDEFVSSHQSKTEMCGLCGSGSRQGPSTQTTVGDSGATPEDLFNGYA